MMDSKVETISRLAQWRIDNFSPGSYRKSDPFKAFVCREESIPLRPFVSRNFQGV
ncbi:hypothetical protein SLEP1_g45698 [Rubroshorea leprosula]|uniref:Uncharacterized protein n=1 Tax=Rubroshorea leprosula TaxID=152421 RepID=A0AAV5LJU3_9ROSI|nr:hypothetical protein SLEP1_g45698 [Rubroshorea leprosula]